jgi:hypothetical protein
VSTLRTPAVEDNTIIERALRAYFRRFGKHADFPSSYGCSVSVRGVVTLRNGHRTLACYRYDSKADRLAFVP